MAAAAVCRRRVETVLRWLSLTDFLSYRGGAIRGAHLGGFHSMQWRRRSCTMAGLKLVLRWRRELALMGGRSRDRLKQMQ
jgi:hypothetical protein